MMFKNIIYKKIRRDSADKIVGTVYLIIEANFLIIVFDPPVDDDDEEKRALSISSLSSKDKMIEQAVSIGNLTIDEIKALPYMKVS